MTNDNLSGQEPMLGGNGGILSLRDRLIELAIRMVIGSDELAPGAWDSEFKYELTFDTGIGVGLTYAAADILEVLNLLEDDSTGVLGLVTPEIDKKIQEALYQSRVKRGLIG
jgi:hypothetical protein